MTATTRVWIDLRPGECIRLGGLDISIEMVDKSGRAARLGINAPRSVSIRRDVSGAHDTKHATMRMHTDDGAQECSEVELQHLGGS